MSPLSCYVHSVIANYTCFLWKFSDEKSIENGYVGSSQTVILGSALAVQQEVSSIAKYSGRNCHSVTYFQTSLCTLPIHLTRIRPLRRLVIEKLIQYPYLSPLKVRKMEANVNCCRLFFIFQIHISSIPHFLLFISNHSYYFLLYRSWVQCIILENLLHFMCCAFYMLCFLHAVLFMYFLFLLSYFSTTIFASSFPDFLCVKRFLFL